MKKGLTELVFILDRSGSMSGLETDTIGGYNAMLEKQKKGPGEAMITTVLFDDSYELLHDGVDLRSVIPMTDHEYFVRGTTALLDAVGKTILKISNSHKQIAEEERAENVMVVITTDGMENASKEFNYEKVRNMIEHQKSKYGWEFLFLGANIDAIATANLFGIEEDRATNFHADSDGTQLNYEVISETISSLREHNKIEGNWKERIEADYRLRD
ncbi:VWA domain-containing protein [Sporosarcina sp. ACRSL]|uniref:vWA domain-containing protein n=1 Tax=Sporosarcina sp. ACRSL TaxID=2918215 RepID=UPI001EF6F7EA|nr:vWA domain-containing protein [Sporosarcina sp. ACRSL]MCG7344840.1 VWA domain-containing protein [Sporosarcina sp. ACRSL]